MGHRACVEDNLKELVLSTMKVPGIEAWPSVMMGKHFYPLNHIIYTYPAIYKFCLIYLSSKIIRSSCIRK